MICSQPICGLRQSILGCSALPLKWKMIGFSCWDEVPMVSTLVYDIRLSSSHGFTKLRSCTFSQPWENIEFVQKLAVTFTYRWYPKLIIYSLWIGLLLTWMKISVIMDILANILTQNIPKIHQNLWKCKKKTLKKWN